MAHFVTGLVASAELLNDFARARSLRPSVALTGGLSLLPLRDRDIDAFLNPPLGEFEDGFNYLSAALASELRSASAAGRLLYFETEYFGGAGSQGAVLFENGDITFGPQVAESGPINEALARLGVAASSSQDEFQIVGLDRHRSADEWLGLDEDDE